MKFKLSVAKRIALKIAAELPLPLLLKLSDGKISPQEAAELGSLVAKLIIEEFGE
jgi:hypothetical protein